MEFGMDAWIVWVAGVLTALMTIGGFVAWVWRKVAVPVRGKYESGCAFVKRVAEACDLVEVELRPNCGSSIRDIVERIDRRTTANEALSFASIEQAGAAIWIADAGGLWTRTSREMCRLCRRTEDELLGLGWKSVVSEAERESVGSAWAGAVVDGRTFRSHFSIDLPGGGDPLPVSVEAVVMRDHEDEPIGWMGKMVLGH